MKLLITTVRTHPFLIYSFDYGSAVLYVVRTNVEIVGGCFTRAIVRSGFCVSNGENSTKTTTTTTIGNEFDRSSRSEGSPTREVYTGALLIICRRLSSSREKSSLERFFFSFYSRFSFFVRVVAFFFFFSSVRITSCSVPPFFLMPNGQLYL